MKKFRWQLLIIFLTATIVGILLLSEQQEPVTTAITSPQPVQGGVYTEALVGSPMRFNPLLAFYNPVDRDVTRLIFSGLLRFDSTGAPVEDLAESWGVSQDGTLYNVTIRENAQWHDGEPVTASDVLFTIELMRNGADIVPVDLQDFWKEVDVVVLDERVLQFRLPSGFAPFPDYLTFGVLPQHLLEGVTLETMIDHPFNMQPVGSGPYQFVRLMVEDGQIQGVTLAAFEEYYIQKPYIDEVVFRYYTDAPAALAAYQDGLVQGISQVTPEILAEALAEPNLSTFTARRPELVMVLFNLQNTDVAFLQEAEVRRALLSGLNRQRIIDTILQGQAIIADGPILPDTWAYYTGLQRVEFDPQAAADLLDEAGYVLGEGQVVRAKDEAALRFSLLYPDDDRHEQLAGAIQAYWTALGVEVTLEPAPYDVLVSDRLQTRDYQAALVDLNLSSTPDPDPYPFWDQAQAATGQNFTQWDNRVASEYLEQARVTVNLSERAKFYRNFQIIFHQDLPALPLYYPVYTYAISNDIRGVQVGPIFNTSDRFANVNGWFLAGQEEERAPVEPTSTTQPANP